jgi:competence protein ComFC
MPGEYFTHALSKARLPRVPDGLALFDYSDPFVKHLIWTLKYKGNKKILRICAGRIYDIIIHELTELKTFSHFSDPLLLPIPISKQRKKKRGFNQMELVAKTLADLDRNTFFILELNILRKSKHTPPQTILGRKERLKNLRGCFEVVNKERIKNRNIILLDDVATTGSTLREARRVLLDAGARRVISFALAH